MMNLQEMVQNSKGSLTETEWEIYDYLSTCHHPWKLTINDLSKDCHVSTTTVFRFCKKLGLQGFSELKARLKFARSTNEHIKRIDFQETYHQVVDYISQYDTRMLLQYLKTSETIYLFARSELEMRLAKDFQRIFFPFGKTQIILPSNQALLAQEDLKGNLLFMFYIDSIDALPMELQSAKWISDVFTVLFSDIKDIPVLVNDHFYIPNLSSKNIVPDNHITPYTLAIEMLYLKLQLS